MSLTIRTSEKEDAKTKDTLAVCLVATTHKSRTVLEHILADIRLQLKKESKKTIIDRKQYRAKKEKTKTTEQSDGTETHNE